MLLLKSCMRISILIIALGATVFKSIGDNSPVVIASLNKQAVNLKKPEFSASMVKDLYQRSDLVVNVKVLGATKNADVYIVNTEVKTVYKGKWDTSHLEYEAFLEEGSYKEFYGKDLIVFLKKQDNKFNTKGVKWGRTEPNVEFAYDDKLSSYLLKLK